MNLDSQKLKSALQWYIDHGVDEVMGDAPTNYLNNKIASPKIENIEIPKPANTQATSAVTPNNTVLGTIEATKQAIELANGAQTLDELREAIADFDGLSVKKTALNMVFSDGHPGASVMLIGEAPGADEDRQGKPFVGVSGQLLDKILAAIELSRAKDTPEKGVYISNILNWRPPGNRTPTPQEINISLPFIEKHILLVKPKFIILCGGVSAKSLLYSDTSVSKLRKTWHTFTPKSGIKNADNLSIPALVTYHPAYLLRTPIQKRACWADMLMLAEKLRTTQT